MNYKLSIRKKGFEPVTIEDIQSFENKLGHKLPQDYKDFLLLYNGCFTGGEIYKYKRINHWNGDLEEIEFWLERFIPLESNITDSKIDLYDDTENGRPDRKYLKIAESPCGSEEIHLSINDGTYGNIYYIDPPHEGYFYKIANNFTEFINGFIYEPFDYPYIDDDEVWTTVP